MFQAQMGVLQSRSNVSSVKGILFVFAILLASLAAAVDSFDYHCANIAILQNGPNGLGRKVQQELGITSQQRERMNKVADVGRTKMEAYQKSLNGKKPDFKVISSYMDDMKKGIVAVMSPPQVKRLRELNLQAAGLLGLMDQVVATKIGMGKEQYTKFRQAYISGKSSAEKIVRAAILPIDQKYQKLALPYKGKENQHKDELKKLTENYVKEARAAQQRIQAQVSAITRQTEQKLMAMITPQQKAAWTALQGKKFDPSKAK
jgi:hypothetical protein